MIKCGITGATGVLGRKIRNTLSYKFIKFRKDITKKKEVENWLKKNQFDLIIHLAAIVPTATVKKNYTKAKNVNFLGTKNLIDSINKLDIQLKWFFYASTSHVYKIRNKAEYLTENSKKKPHTLYGKTKLMAESYINTNLNKKYKACIGRIFSFTDRLQKKDFFFPSIKNRVLKSKLGVLKFDNLNHFRDFISTEDICLAIDNLWKIKANGVYNIASGKSISLEKIVSMICIKLKRKFLITKNKKKPTFLMANIKKIKKTNWKPKKKIETIIDNYFSIS